MSNIFEDQQNKLRQVSDLYYYNIKQCQQESEIENQRAISIQKNVRMFRLNKYYNLNRRAAILIQRYIRSYLARKNFKRLKYGRHNYYNIRYYNFQASVIQRYYRGYIRRKYYHDFFARKQYLTYLINKNDAFKKELEQNAIKEAEEEQTRYLMEQKSEFMKLAQNLHHLSSTAIQPGIYKPPFAQFAPRVFDVEVEEQIRAAFKNNYKLRPLKSACPKRALSGNKGELKIVNQNKPSSQQMGRRLK